MMKPWIDIERKRRELRALEAEESRKTELWRCVKRLARENPGGNPWLTPFVALIDERPEDIAHARAAIDDYLAMAEQRGSRGYLFNIWCFAFPHCRWAMWFDLMRQAGFYTPEEADAIAAKFLLIQFRDHHACMLIKPFPECVDNQAAALVLSSYLVGSIFAEGPGDGHLARKMRDEAAPRLEAMIGGMPTSGYSGEGSTYQGLIVAFAVPLLVAALEALRGEDVFDSPLWPNGTSPRKILEMTRRLWMPGGLLLPWDHYGYQFGITFPLAYLAYRTGDRQALRLLEQEANYSRMTITSSGWGYDQPIWTLLYWPDAGSEVEGSDWQPWVEDGVGGVLVDPAGEAYLMQMWDETAPMCHRTHVNPNSLVLAHKGIPFTADGAKAPECDALHYEGAVFERSFGAGAHQTINLSSGCAGSHNAILIDGNEALRPPEQEWHGKPADFDGEGQSITGDVTGLYASVYPDCRAVRRRSRLIENRFWLIEDLADFPETSGQAANEHRVTSRWWFRPDARAVDGGVDVETPEGALLQMRCVLGSDQAAVTRVDGYPVAPDGCSDRVDFDQHGSQARWLYVLWPTETIETVRELTEGWDAQAVATGERYAVHPGSPPWFQQEIPISAEWTYSTEIDVSGVDQVQLRLPRGIDATSRLQINGTAHDLGKMSGSKLLPTLIDCTPYLVGQSTLKIELSMVFATGQDEKGSSMSFPDQPVALCACIREPDRLSACRYEDGMLTVETTSGQRFETEHDLMEV